MENIITCEFASGELEVLYFAVEEHAGELRSESEASNISPLYRKNLKHRLDFIQKLLVNMEQILDGQAVSPQDELSQTVTFTKTENSILGRFSSEEAEEVCYAIIECEGALRTGSKEPSISPSCRQILKKHYEIAHGLMFRIEQAIDEQSTPSAPLEPFPTNIMDDIYSFVSRSAGYLP